MQAWAEFCERFGLPMIAATTNQFDNETIDKIDYQLSNLAQAARGVFPSNTTVEFKEANRTDAYQTFEYFKKSNNDEIAKPIVGGTMLTDNGSSRSQSEVHERNIDDKIAKADKLSISFIINDDLLPLLRNQGYTFIGENDSFSFSESHNLTLVEFWKITSEIMSDYDVDPQWISKTWGVPIEGKKKAV